MWFLTRSWDDLPETYLHTHRLYGVVSQGCQYAENSNCVIGLILHPTYKIVAAFISNVSACSITIAFMYPRWQ